MQTNPSAPSLPLNTRAHGWCLDCHRWLAELPPTADEYEECTQIIGWFGTLVPAKLYRATQASAALTRDSDPQDPRLVDARDSARSATRSLHHVIQALTRWLRAHPRDERARALLCEAWELVEDVKQAFPHCDGSGLPALAGGRLS